MTALSDLTAAQIAAISNGCGPKSWKFTIPTWHGRNDCCQHDLDYWIGGTEDDRAVADQRLYNGLIASAKSAWFGARVWMRVEAWAFYRAVRRDGAAHFHHGRQRTIAEIPVIP